MECVLFKYYVKDEELIKNKLETIVEKCMTEKNLPIIIIIKYIFNGMKRD